jgi:hypothetical protein
MRNFFSRELRMENYISESAKFGEFLNEEDTLSCNVTMMGAIKFIAE